MLLTFNIKCLYINIFHRIMPCFQSGSEPLLNLAFGGLEVVLGDVFIVSAVRTPIGKFGGKLAQMSSPDLGVVASKAALERAGVDPGQVEEAVFGSARQAGNGPNSARQISVRSGIPKETPAYTVNQACASGMKAIALGFQEIAFGAGWNQALKL